MKIELDPNEDSPSFTPDFTPSLLKAHYKWSAPDGTPPTGTDEKFVTRFGKAGKHKVTCEVTSVDSASKDALPKPKELEVVVRTPSDDPSWVNRYHGSTSLNDLDQSFKGNVEKFKRALEAAGATVTVASTRRPFDMQFIMYWANEIANLRKAPKDAPHGSPDIAWLLRSADGMEDRQKSIDAAKKLVADFGIGNNPVATPEGSRHVSGLAIDMTIEWSGDLSIIMPNDAGITLIKTLPRQVGIGSDGNAELHAIGAAFGVKKKVGDSPHWSIDGN